MSIHRLLFGMIVIVWTRLLLKPNPVPTFVAESLLDDFKFVLGKALHFFAFAFLAWYGTYRMLSKNRKWLWLGLAVYAIATELGQHYGDQWFETHRSGSVRDVIIDWCGILAAAALRRRFRSSCRANLRH